VSEGPTSLKFRPLTTEGFNSEESLVVIFFCAIDCKEKMAIRLALMYFIMVVFL
jgi:hypothetical protein